MVIEAYGYVINSGRLSVIRNQIIADIIATACNNLKKAGYSMILGRKQYAYIADT